MGLRVPTVKEIAARMAATLEAAVLAAAAATAAATGVPVDPDAVSRAVRGATGVMAMILRAVALELRSVYAHIAWWVRQWFVDTADDETIIRRHADIWGIAPRPATRAVGTLTLIGTPGGAMAQGTELVASGGVTLVSDAAVTIGNDGTAAVPVTATTAGVAGNLEAGVRVSPQPALSFVDRVLVADGGLAGGADAESAQSLQQRTIAHIRQRPHGGAGFDYQRWLADAFAVHAVKVLPDWIGRGSVGVAVAMTDNASVFGRAPNATELEAMLAHLGAPGSATGVRPVTAHIVMLAAVSQAQDLTIRLRPDNATTRQAVTEAWHVFLASLGDADDDQNDGPIGARIELSRLSEALSAADGEYAHDLIAPVANVQLGDTAYAVPGALTFAAAP